MATEKKRGKKPLVDNTLVRRVKNDGCNDSFIEILNRHEKLYYKICQKYIPVVLAKGLRKDDLLDDKEFVVFKAVSSYKINKKCKFSTWLGNCTKYHCLTFINSNNKEVDLEDETINLYLTDKSKEDFDTECSLKDEKEYVFKILNKLKDKRISKVFKLRYFDKNTEKKKVTWSSIASQIDTSTQTAINLHQRGVNILSKKLKSKELYDDI
jgi:RNA polymerase sigma factor (sigma-70 family)